MRKIVNQLIKSRHVAIRKMLLCVIFVLLASGFGAGIVCAVGVEGKGLILIGEKEEVVFTSASSPSDGNNIEFYFNNRVFSYDFLQNKKTNNQFDLNFELNKFNRNGTMEERKALMQKLVNLGFDNFVVANYLFPNLENVVLKMEKNVFVAPQDAKLKINSNSEKVFFITNEVVGQKLNKNALYETIIKNFLQNKPLKIDLPIIKLSPAIVAADYEKFAHLRADFATDFSASSADRKHNIKNALNSLNKTEVYPNQIFSFNKTVGRRTAENGYRQAKIIVNNEFVDGLGGGVCQVSTTLYNSALLAGLNIVEANKHSKQINYVKYGFDAMVNFGSSDLKFKNNTGQKITIITNHNNNKARIRIFGELPLYTYKLTNEIVSTTAPGEQVIVDTKGEYINNVQFDDEFFYLKRGTRGMEVKSFREIYKDGKLIDKESLRFDKFKPIDAIVVYGAKKRKENFFASMAFD